MGNYTTLMEDALFFEPEIIDDYEAATMAFLNCDGLCRTFGEALLTFMQAHCGYIDDDPISFLKSKCKEHNVPTEDIAKDNRTFKGWFYGNRRLEDRRPMFAIAFALGLDAAQTKELFNKVMLDRAFEFRNTDEIIYYYCIKRRRTWDDAKSLINRAAVSDVENTDYTVATQFLRLDADALKDDSELLDFVAKHGHNLSLKNVTAKKVFEGLIEKARELAQKEADALIRDGNNEPIWEKFKCFDPGSNSFLYYVITDQSLVGENGTKSVFGEVDKKLKSNAFSCFPTDKSFSGKDLSNEKLRKALVLVHFYYFWEDFAVNNKGKRIPYGMFDDYQMAIDTVLAECGFSAMYPGNPFDWLFLYCSLEEDPINALRSVIGNMIEPEDE